MRDKARESATLQMEKHNKVLKKAEKRDNHDE